MNPENAIQTGLTNNINVSYESNFLFLITEDNGA